MPPQPLVLALPQPSLVAPAAALQLELRQLLLLAERQLAAPVRRLLGKLLLWPLVLKAQLDQGLLREQGPSPEGKLQLSPQGQRQHHPEVPAETMMMLAAQARLLPPQQSPQGAPPQGLMCPLPVCPQVLPPLLEAQQLARPAKSTLAPALARQAESTLVPVLALARLLL